jgi:hypothetical protein
LWERLWDMAVAIPYLFSSKLYITGIPTDSLFCLATSFMLVTCFTDFSPWRWKWYIALKHWFTYRLQCVISQKMAPFGEISDWHGSLYSTNTATSFHIGLTNTDDVAEDLMTALDLQKQWHMQAGFKNGSYLKKYPHMCCLLGAECLYLQICCRNVLDHVLI